MPVDKSLRCVPVHVPVFEHTEHSRQHSIVETISRILYRNRPVPMHERLNDDDARWIVPVHALLLIMPVHGHVTPLSTSIKAPIIGIVSAGAPVCDRADRCMASYLYYGTYAGAWASCLLRHACAFIIRTYMSGRVPEVTHVVE